MVGDYPLRAGQDLHAILDISSSDILTMFGHHLGAAKAMPQR
jgi:hypothetical protein